MADRTSWFRDRAVEHAEQRAKRTKDIPPPRFSAGPQTDGLVPVLEALEVMDPQPDWNDVWQEIHGSRT